MRALIKKEWRENRALILGLVVIAPLAALAVRQWITGWEGHAVKTYSIGITSSLLAIFVLGVGADLVAGDTSSGRIRFFAALPVRPATLWGAKVLFLLTTAGLYLAFLLLIEALIFNSMGLDAGLVFARQHWEHLPGTLSRTEQLAIVLAGGACALFYGTLIDRGFAIVVATIATVGGVTLAYHASGVENRTGDLDLRLATAALFAAAFLLGSFFAFTRGRIQLGSRLRRALIGTAAVLLVALPTLGWAKVTIASYQDLEPRDQDLELHVRMPHQGGNWAIVWASRPGSPPLGAREPLALWAVHLDEGTVRPLLRLFDDHRWDFPSILPAGKGRIEILDRGILRTVDLDSGRSVKQVALTHEEARAVYMRAWRRPVPSNSGEHDHYYYGPRPFDCPEGFHASLDLDDRSAVLHRGGEYMIYLAEEDRFIPVDPPDEDWWRVGGLMPEDREGSALLLSRNGSATRCVLDRIPLDGAPAERVIEGAYGGDSFSPDRRKAVLFAKGGPWLLLAGNAPLTRIPVPGTLKGRALWDWDSLSFVLLTEAGEWHVELGDGGLTVNPISLPDLPGRLVHLVGNRFLHIERRGEGDVVEAVRLDGTVVRLLPRGDE